MKTPTPIARLRLRDDRGGVLVFVALLLPFIIGLLALAIDVGHWYEHRRHLQLQVDAAALAGGGLFSECLANTATAEGDMETKAAEYGLTRNPQIGGGTHTGSLQFGYQSPTYPVSQPSGWAGDDTLAGQSACGSGMFDVKATESGIPHFFVFTPLATVHAHARVELRALNEQNGLLPIGVPDTRFNFAFANFIDESTGNPLATDVPLVKTGISGGQQLWSSSLTSVPIGAATNIGVWIRLVGGTDPTAGCNQLYTECYDAGAVDANQQPTQGIIFLHGWSGSAPTPRVADAWLLAGNCSPDAYFTTADCVAGIQANVDLGNHPLSGNGAAANVWAVVDGVQYQLSQGSGSGLVTWTLSSGLPISGGGPHPISLGWSWQQTAGTWNGNTCKSGGGNKCTDSGSFGTVQRSFEATADRSGSLQRVQIFASGVSSGANSVQGPSATLGVSLATTGSLAVQAAASAPVIYLRVVGSQNGSIDCDPNQPNLRAEIGSGCAPLYKVNPGSSCPSYTDLWGTPQPWDCVKTQTGGATGQVKQGMLDRIGNSCAAAPITWPYDPTKPDPRVIPLIVTPFGTFTGSGNDIVPVIDFGTFYLMGFEGDPCPNAVKVPKGFIAGHFIKYIPPTPRGVGDAICSLSDPTQITPCVPVMTR